MTEPLVVDRRLGSPVLCFCHGGYPEGFEAIPGAVIGDDREATVDWIWIRQIARSAGPVSAIVEDRMKVALCDECLGVWEARYAEGAHPPDATYEVERR